MEELVVALGHDVQLVVDAAVPGVGNVIEQLADQLDIVSEGNHEFLHVRLSYDGAD